MLNFKKIIVLSSILTLTLQLLAATTLAQEKTATKSASPTTQDATASAVSDEKVKNLKEKLATTVAQLRENQTRGFFGEISALSKTSFTLSIASSEVKVRYNEDTLVFKLGDKRIESSSSDLKNGMTVSVLGLFEADSSIHTAKVILIDTIPSRFFGEATLVDKTNANFTLKNSKGKETSYDYEKTTKAIEYQLSDKKLVKSGLSRIAVGDRVEVWGNPSEEDQQKIKVLRLVRIPKELFDEGTTSASPSPLLKPDESTPAPTSKPSPKTTPKASPKPSAS